MQLNGLKIDVVIPALNEEKSIAKVLEEIPDFVREIIVIDNGSTDETYERAKQSGATVLQTLRKGYGRACLAGISYLSEKEDQPDIVVFLDGDYSDFPSEMDLLIKPILEGNVDMVIGSRALGERQKGSMTVPQRFGNYLATRLLKWLYGVKFTDLGPFRAIRFQKLLRLNMIDKNYGWTVEMQLKAAKTKLNCHEVPVSYRKRIGESKVSGTVKGTLLAGYKILFTIFRYL